MYLFHVLTLDWLFFFKNRIEFKEWKRKTNIYFVQSWTIKIQTYFKITTFNYYLLIITTTTNFKIITERGETFL